MESHTIHNHSKNNKSKEPRAPSATEKSPAKELTSRQPVRPPKTVQVSPEHFSSKDVPSILTSHSKEHDSVPLEQKKGKKDTMGEEQRQPQQSSSHRRKDIVSYGKKEQRLEHYSEMEDIQNEIKENIAKMLRLNGYGQITFKRTDKSV